MSAALEALLDAADVVNLHCPLTAETEGMIGAEAFRRMNPNTILINTARGEIVDVPAMIAAIRRGEIAGAGIDVLPTEPPNATDEIAVAYRDLKAAGIADRLILQRHAALLSPVSRRLYGRNSHAVPSQRASAQSYERFLPAERETLRLLRSNHSGNPVRQRGERGDEQPGMESSPVSRRAQWRGEAFVRAEAYVSKGDPRLVAPIGLVAGQRPAIDARDCTKHELASRPLSTLPWLRRRRESREEARLRDDLPSGRRQAPRFRELLRTGSTGVPRLCRAPTTVKDGQSLREL